MLKSLEATVMNHYPRNGWMGNTEPPNNILPKTKHPSSSILSYRVGLDPIATSIPYRKMRPEWCSDLQAILLNKVICLMICSTEFKSKSQLDLFISSTSTFALDYVGAQSFISRYANFLITLMIIVNIFGKYHFQT